METPKLIIDSDREVLLEDELITIGRSSDNTIPFPDDSNISRYHAEIERRDDDFWIIDLGSFNGTTVNGERIETDKPLNNGDEILFGGTSKIEIVLSERIEDKDKDKDKDKEKDEPTSANDTPPKTPEKSDSPPAEKKSSKLPLMLIVAALAVGLAVIFVAAAALFYFTQDSAECTAQVTITKPENDDVIKEVTEIEIELTGGECIQKVSYRVEDKEFASSNKPPYSASISPEDFEFSDGVNRNLKVVLFDGNGKQISQSSEVAFFVESIAEETSTPTPIGNTENPPPTQPIDTPQNTKLSASDSIKMSNNIIKQFSGNSAYKLNQRFLQEVRKMTAKYVSEGFYERAKKYRDVINIQFIQERSLAPPLGFILAMSRTKFNPPNQTDGAGLWRMNNQLVLENSYNGLCGSETLTSETQKCAAIASSSYLKDIIVNVFEGDIIYSIAAFGMSQQDAITWKETLPADKKDFWNVIRDPKQREEVVKFFAAAIVAENPKKFGLKKEKPLSTLYAVYMR